MPALLPSELPIRAQTRHHWIVLLRPPHKIVIVLLLTLLVLSIFFPAKIAWVLALIVLGMGLFRWREWRAEWIILTRKRIIRVEGLPETTTTEASLRVERISGAVLVQTLFGKLLDYGTLELEAPGEHPDVRDLRRIADPTTFYLELRQVIFGEPSRHDPDDGPEPEREPERRRNPRDGGWSEPSLRSGRGTDDYDGNYGDEDGNRRDTAPLPRLPSTRDRFGRRR